MSDSKTNMKGALNFLYKILPYVNLIRNKTKFFFFIIFRRPSTKLTLKGGIHLSVKKSQIEFLINLLAVLKYASEFSYLPDGRITVQFDKGNKFTFSLDLDSLEIVNILELFHYGIKYGAYFHSDSSPEPINYKKSIKIIDINGKKIIQTHSGLKFYLDSIQSWPFIETFILGNHEIEFFDSLREKIVLDIGAHTGDTALFYASHGAKVYAFEPLKANYENMLKNITLNQKYRNNIIPVNAAIGNDGFSEIHHSIIKEIDGMASLHIKQNDKNHTTSKVRVYSLNSVLKKYNIAKIDLLKMDCKGCEFFLDDEDLKNVNYLKIEYTPFDDYKLENLTLLLERNGFKLLTYLHNPRRKTSPIYHGTLLAVKD